MNSPLLLSIVTALARNVGMWLSAYLVAKGVLKPDQSDQLVEAIIKHVLQAMPALLIIGWSVRDKVKAHLKYLAARFLSASATEEQVARYAKAPEIKQLAFVNPKDLGMGEVPPAA